MKQFKFQWSLLVREREYIVPAAVRSHINKGRLQSSQYIQQTTKVCTTLNYTVFSQQNVTIELYPDGQCSTVSDKLFLWLHVSQSCPLGFNTNPVVNLCVRGQTLQYQQLQYNKWIRANNTWVWWCILGWLWPISGTSYCSSILPFWLLCLS